jgi:hypothetical protein
MIPLSYIPANIQTEDVLLYSYWSSNIQPVEVSYRQGDPVPADVTLNIRVNDIFNTIYNEALGPAILDPSYKVSASIQNVAPASGSNWVTTTFNEQELTENNTYIDVPLSFVGVQGLTLGTYHKKLKLYILKYNSSFASVLSTFEVDIHMNVVSANEILASPLILDFEYPVGLPILPSSEDVVIMAPESTHWVVMGMGPNTSGNPQIKIESLASDVEISINPIGKYTATGKGTRTLKISLSNGFMLAPLGSYLRALGIHQAEVNSSGEIISILPMGMSVPVNVNVIPNQLIWASTDNLTFSAIRGIQEAGYKSFNVFSELPISVNTPSWLGFEVVSTLTPYIYRVKIMPVNTSSIGEGNYFGNITIKNAEAQTSVAVNYKVTDGVLWDYENDLFHFALDEKFIEFQSPSDDVFYEVKVLMSITPYIGEIIQKDVTFQVPIYKGKGSFNVGKIVQRIIQPESEELLLDGYSMEPLNVQLIAQKKLQLNRQNIGLPQSIMMKYIAGRTPEQVSGNIGLLCPKVFAKRITSKSVEFLNVVVKNNASFITTELKRNGEVIPELSSPIGISTLLKFSKSIYIPFRESSITQGDQLVMSVTNPFGNSTINQQYICFPDGVDSNHIVWIDNYKLRQIFEFTGEYKVESEIANSNQNIRKKLVNSLQKVSSKKISKLTIDTGWIPEDHQSLIEDLMMSKSAWLLNDDMSVKFRLTPISEKITNYDSKRMLVSYSVEFQINPDYDEKNSSF